MRSGKTYQMLQVSVLRGQAFKKYLELCNVEGIVPKKEIIDIISRVSSIESGNIVIDFLEEIIN